MEQNLIRLLKANEIECRISTITEKGLSLLLYKDARVDQRILDETFGAFGWKRSHQSIEGNLYCTVEIRDKESGEWINKQDVGTTGYAEKEKTQASDSFKRACFNWGIGRELYTAPFIWIPEGKAKIQKKDNRFYCNDRFSVGSIGYNENREIKELVIVNGKGQPVYELKAVGSVNSDGQQNAAQKQETAITRKQMEGLKAELARTGVAMEDVQKRYKIQEPETMSEGLYNKVMLALSRTKSANVA